jgi:hypothetical protein
MIVLLPAEVQAYSFGGWSLSLWVGEVFDEEANAPLAKSAIRDLEKALQGTGYVALDMPEFSAWDIVAEGTLAWRDYRFRLVVNTSDGVVGIEHEAREPLDILLNAIKPFVSLVE